MSSNDDEILEFPSSARTAGKKRVQRACDQCRRKKIRCDGRNDNRCSNCLTLSLECSYAETAKKRLTPKGYVEKLEARVEILDKVFQRLYPGVDLSGDLDNLILDTGATPATTKTICCSHKNYPPSEIAASVIRNISSPMSIPDDGDLGHIDLAIMMKKYHGKHKSKIGKFMGKSSNAMFVRDILALRQQFTGDENSPVNPLTFSCMRDFYWKTQPWETTNVAPPPPLVFPDDDLLHDLIELYFDNYNLLYPVIYRPAFERSLKQGLHMEDYAFGSLVLLLCAVAARFSDDRRVLLDGVDTWHCAGWKYFSQVRPAKKTFVPVASLCDLQIICVMIQFLHSSAAAHTCWILAGIGIRLAEDLGIHRRRGKGELPSIEYEQLKRAFWALVCFDRIGSFAFGRPCAVQDEDFDLDPPIECDDEFWESNDGSIVFQQPPDKPSKIAFFNSFLRLNQLLGMALRTLYATNQSMIQMGLIGKDWQQPLVAELDSALNKFLDTVPTHLRWDPNREDFNHFRQSALLYAFYYQLQVVVHRPFIPSQKKLSELALPSLAICTNAARRISNIVEAQTRRVGFVLPQIQAPLAFSCIVLLLSMWGSKRSGLATNANKAMNDVQKCMVALKKSERRWANAGRMWDILYELTTVRDVSVPEQKISPSSLSHDSPYPSETSTPGVASSKSGTSPALSPYSASDIYEPINTMPLQSQHQSFPNINPTVDPEAQRFLSKHDGLMSELELSWQFPQHPETLGPDRAAVQVGYVDNLNNGSPFEKNTIDNTMQDFGAANQDLFSFLDNDVLAMWSNAPAGYDLDEWGQYLSSVSDNNTHEAH